MREINQTKNRNLSPLDLYFNIYIITKDLVDIELIMLFYQW